MESNTWQVLITLRASLLPSLTLGTLADVPPAPLHSRAAYCFKCRKYGRQQATCTLLAKCGICSRAKTQRLCLTNFKAKPTVADCPYWEQKRHADNSASPGLCVMLSGSKNKTPGCGACPFKHLGEGYRTNDPNTRLHFTTPADFPPPSPPVNLALSYSCTSNPLELGPVAH